MADDALPGRFDDLVAQHAPAGADAPTAPAPLGDFDALVDRYRPRYAGGLVPVHPLDGESWDLYFSQAPAGRVLDAFGQGAEQGWGSGPVGLAPETEEFLRKHGVFNDYENGRTSLIKTANEVLIRPIAAAADAAMRGISAAGMGVAAAGAQALTEAGFPRAGREFGAMVESGAGLLGSPSALPAHVAEAADLKVIGSGGDAAYFGTADEAEAAQSDALKQAIRSFTPSQELPSKAAPAAAEAPEAAAPDVHQVARSLAPDTFGEFDALAQRKATFQGWIDELGAARPQASAATGAQARIDDILDKVDGVEAKLTKAQAGRLADARADLHAALTTDTPDMARVRRDLMATDYRMRDLAPDVSAAYQRARAMMPPEAAPEPEAVPAEEPTAAPAAAAEEAQVAEPPQVAPEAQEAAAVPAEAATEAPAAKPPVAIAGDVARQLVAAGRPSQEADAAAAIVAAHYEARAARLGTTAADLYRDEPVNVEGAPRGRKGEMGRTVLKDGQATIRLMANADASTFLHETGHSWLEELMRDAQDERAVLEVKADAATVRNWLGTKEGDAVTRAQHEKFARGFERYLMEGRAPSAGLVGVFGQFRQWLTSIYQTVARLRSPITDDIRDVFDRLIAKPGGETVVAEEHEGAMPIGDVHAKIAEGARETARTPDDLLAERDRIRAEADDYARLNLPPEFIDELGIGNRERPEIAGGPPEGGLPDGGGNAGQPVAGTAGIGATARAVGAGGSEIAAGSAELGVRERGVASVAPAEPHGIFDEPQSPRLDKAGNIRLDTLNAPEDVSAVIREVADESGGFMAARGVVPDSEVLSLADAMGVRAARLNLAEIAGSLGQGQLAVKVMAARKLLIQSATAVRDAMVKAGADTASDADVLAYAQAKLRHRMIQEQLSGVTAEAGRALRAFRQIEGQGEAQAISAFVDQATGRTLFQLRREARRGAALDTPAKVSKFVADSSRPGVFDWLQSVFINALLSGPLTHLGYTAAGEMFALFRAGVEAPIAAAVGRLREVTGAGPEERAHFREAPQQLYGMYSGARAGLRAAYLAAKVNDVVLPPEAAALRESGRIRGTTGQSVNPRAVIPNPKIAGRSIPVGTAIESPGRLVAALHSFNWTTFYTQSLRAQAFRAAVEEGLDVGSRQFSRRVADLSTTPSVEMIKAASEDADSGALMQRPAYGSFMGNISRLANIGVKVPDIPLPGARSIPMGTLRPVKYIDPFVQIQGNIQKMAFLRGTPLALFKGSVRDDLMMRNGGAAFDRTAGKLIAGTGFMIAVGSLAAEGLMNPSGPSTPAQAAGWRRIHGLPHGLHIGNLTFDMLRFGNLGLQMSVAADLYHGIHQIGQDDANKIAADLVHAFAQNIVDESSMRGVSEILRAVDDSNRYGEEWVRNFLSSAIPFSVGLGQVARQIDPDSRDARTTMDAIIAKLPFASEELPPRYDVWGVPVPNEGWAGTYYIGLMNDPVDKAAMDAGAYPSPPRRTIRGVQLSPEQYADYSRIAGRLAHQFVGQVAAQPTFSMLPLNIRHDLIKDAVSKSRRLAEGYVMMRSQGTANDIIAQAVAAKTAPLKQVQH